MHVLERRSTDVGAAEPLAQATAALHGHGTGGTANAAPVADPASMDQDETPDPAQAKGLPALAPVQHPANGAPTLASGPDPRPDGPDGDEHRPKRQRTYPYWKTRDLQKDAQDR